MISLKRFLPFYEKLAATLVNNIVIFILVNLLLFFAFLIRDNYLGKVNLVDQAFATYDTPALKKVYPGFTESEINALLTEIWTRPYAYEAFIEFKEAPHTGRYVNVDKSGFRFSKNQGPWPPVSRNFNVFIFGSSSIFNYGLPDAQTIASYLQECLSNTGLKKEVRVYNFGCGYYFSTQEFLSFQRLLSLGFVPDMAVFIDGMAEFFNYSGETNQAQLIKELLEERTKKKTLPPSKLFAKFVTSLPIARAVDFLKRIYDKLLEKDVGIQKKTVVTDSSEAKYNDEKILTSVINRYLANKKLIEAVANLYNVKPIFVWQPIPLYKYDLRYHLFAPKSGNWGRHTYAKYGYLRLAEFLKNQPLGNNFLWCADIQEGLNEPLYVDRAHYTAGMSKRLAGAICELLVKRKLLFFEK